MYNIGFPKERYREFLKVTFIQNIADQIKKQFSRGFLLLTLFTKMSYTSIQLHAKKTLCSKFPISKKIFYQWKLFIPLIIYSTY